MKTEFSPAAQAISDAFWRPGTHVGLNYRLVMALRAVADQVVPPSGSPTKSTKERTLYIEGYKDSGLKVREELLAIATEIENNYD